MVITQRKWQYIKEPEKVGYVISKKLLRKPMYLKSVDKHEFRPLKESDEGFLFYCSPDLSLPEELTLHASPGLHIEIDFAMVKILEPGTIVLRPLQARVSTDNRTHARHANETGFVYCSGFQFTKLALTPENPRLGVSGRLILAEFRKRLARDYPGLEIFHLADKERPELVKTVEKGMKAVWVDDTATKTSYQPRSAEFLDFHGHLESNGGFENRKQEFLREGITSILSVPIIYETPDGFMTIGVIHNETKGDAPHLDFRALCNWREAAFDIIESMHDASTFLVKDRQDVVDISEAGVGLRFRNPELINYLPYQHRVTFDMVFRNQAPLRLSGRVVHYEKEHDYMRAGIKFQGFGHTHSNISVEERLRTFIKLAVG